MTQPTLCKPTRKGIYLPLIAMGMWLSLGWSNNARSQEIGLSEESDFNPPIAATIAANSTETLVSENTETNAGQPSTEPTDEPTEVQEPSPSSTKSDTSPTDETPEPQAAPAAAVTAEPITPDTPLPKVTPIKVWYHATAERVERLLIENLINLWNDENPNMPAVLLPPPINSVVNPLTPIVNQKLLPPELRESLPPEVTEDLPDIIDLFGADFALYSWSEEIVPLNDYRNPLISLDQINDFLPSILLHGISQGDGKLYSLSSNDTAIGIKTRKSLLRKAGIRIPTSEKNAWSRSEFVNGLKKLSKLPGIKYALDLKLGYASQEWYAIVFIPWLQAFGGDVINRENWKAIGTLNSPDSIAAMEFFQSLLVEEKLIAPAEYNDQAFERDRSVAMVYGGQWLWNDKIKEPDDDVIILPLPKLGNRHGFTSGSWGWAITKASKQPQNAAKVLQFLTNRVSALYLSKNLGMVPGRLSSFNESDYYKKGGVFALVGESLKNASSRQPYYPPFPGNRVLMKVFTRAMANIIKGSTVDLELNYAAREIDDDSNEHRFYIKSN